MEGNNTVKCSTLKLKWRLPNNYAGLFGLVKLLIHSHLLNTQVCSKWLKIGRQLGFNIRSFKKSCNASSLYLRHSTTPSPVELGVATAVASTPVGLSLILTPSHRRPTALGQIAFLRCLVWRSRPGPFRLPFRLGGSRGAGGASASTLPFGALSGTVVCLAMVRGDNL